ncbi:integrase [Xenorhabdus mauleonii]|uniref:Integrase n=2 Tax=Xenorhabdus mauleonii TaxID=351675 RepID=A0A1I3JDE3_9GAMM|nr:hypothetical protein [Xenorhabdus mauleonii]PHM46175.1 integrase [Xenorhabdus mauleonii]SFI58224.1 hypothetical protein SAMN05421680_102167 [Xenorhabdus mauleonii]
MFQTDILSSNGHMTMEEIEPMVLLGVIRQFEEHDAMEKTSKARCRCSEMFKYAIVTEKFSISDSRPDLHV